MLILATYFEQIINWELIKRMINTSHSSRLTDVDHTNCLHLLSSGSSPRAAPSPLSGGTAILVHRRISHRPLPPSRYSTHRRLCGLGGRRRLGVAHCFRITPTSPAPAALAWGEERPPRPSNSASKPATSMLNILHGIVGLPTPTAIRSAGSS